MSEKPRIYSVKEMLEEQSPPIDFTINNYMPIGLTILGGRPKIGKSWMALQIAEAVGSGGLFLGEETNQGSVLYITYEDGYERLVDRLKQKNIQAEQAPDLEIMPGGEAGISLGDLSIPDGLEIIEEYAARYRLIIIDTFSRAFNIDYNKNKEVTRVLSPIQQKALENRISILILDHTRKSSKYSTEPFENLLGATAKVAVSDTIWIMSGNAESITLDVTSRDFEGRKINIALDQDNMIWYLNEPQEVVRFGSSQNEVIEFLEDGNNYTCNAIADTLGVDPSNMNKTLKKLMNRGVLKREWRDNVFVYFKG
jgi:RecA-family ATPase